MEPVKGEVWKLVHDRKGTMLVRVESCDPEWMGVTTLRAVKGLAESWEPGEKLTLRKSMVRLLHRTDLPKVL